MKLTKCVMWLALPLALAACGGGDSGGSDARPVTKGPVAHAGADQIVPMGATVQLNGSASEPGTSGGSLSYRWSLPEKPLGSGAAYGDAASATPSFQADLPGRYMATLTVNDGRSESAPAAVTITATTTVPVAIALPVQEVALSAEVLLDGSQSAAPTGGDASALVYRWTLLSKPGASQAELIDATAAKARFYADVEGEYLALLVVNYGDQVSQPREVRVRASAGKPAPVAKLRVVSIGGQPVEPLTNPRLRYQVERGQEVVLSAADSQDANGDPLSYRWGATSWATGSLIANVIQGKQAEFRVTPDVVAKDWTISVQIFDGQRYASASAPFTVVKVPGSVSAAPIAVLGPSTATGTYEMELGQMTNITAFPSYDLDGLGLFGRFKFKLLSHPAGFVPPDWSQQMFTSVQLLPTHAGEYHVQVIANNGEKDSLPVVAVYTARTGANRQPTASINITAATALIQQDIKFGCGGSDPDGDQLSCEWEVLDVPDGSTALLQLSNGGATASFKADKAGRYQVRLVVVDSKGARSLPVVGSIHVKAFNQPPVYAGLYHYAYGEYAILWTSIGDKTRGSQLGTSSQPYLLGQRVDLMPIAMSDPDNDKLYPLWVLVEQPAGSTLVEAVDAEVLSITPTVPGRYVYQFVTSDGLDKAPTQQVAIQVVDEQLYPGLLLRAHGSVTDPSELTPRPGAVQPQLGWPHDWMNTRAYPRDDSTSGGVSKAWYVGALFSMTAKDRDYTVQDLRVQADGDRPDLPRFVGLQNGQVIRRGQTVYFQVFDPRQVSEGVLDPGTEIEWFFRIAERPEHSFRYRQRYQAY